MTLDFEVADPQDIPAGRLTLSACVSRFDSSAGHAPIDVVLQGETLVSDFTVPFGNETPHDSAVVIPGRLLKKGTNTLEIRVSPQARSVFWLYRLTLDPVPEQVRPEHARSEGADTTEAAPVFAFDTERRSVPFSPSAPWQRAPRLLFHIDRDEKTLPSQLSWRRMDGAESSISFQADMSEFHGCHRAADGAVYEFRGRLAGRWPFPEGLENTAASALHRFSTEEEGDGAWHGSPELRLLVDDGGAHVERVSWRDQRGDSGTIMLHAVPDKAEVIGVKANSEFVAAGETADKVLDDSLQTKWLTGGTCGYLIFTFARPTAITSYSLTSANDFIDRDPRDWTLHGSDDGHTWTPLDTRTNETFPRRHETREFHLPAKTPAYLKYCLYITQNSGAGETQLGRVRFDEGTGRAFTGYYQRVDEGPVGYRSIPAATVPTAPAPVAPPSGSVSYTSAFRSFARQHGVSDDAITRILWHVQPAVHLRLEDPHRVGPEDHVVGYVGGLPEMPLDAPWELGNYFVASLDLAAIPKQHLDDGIPREGHLLLFADTDYHASDGGIAPVIHVPPGTEMAVRPAPAERYDDDEEEDVQEVLERQVLILQCASAWDFLDWVPDPGDEWDDDTDGDEKEWYAQLLSAVEEYTARVGHPPVIERTTGKLRGVELNPPYTRANYGSDFLRKREEAVIMLRNDPERFDELYSRALEEAGGGDEGGPWLNLVEFGEDSVFHHGDGELGWVIRRGDLLAGRFDRVLHSYNC
ncbi:discoidin domain-containing protein [Streptomyces sp. NPDC001834]|uniref:discoidin domain-containing protein n=1 Tax=Streptomyces sp. NPDC001834 TaxID=3364616 RepID=UPI0036B08EB8